jgi:hypothetical protein
MEIGVGEFRSTFVACASVNFVLLLPTSTAIVGSNASSKRGQSVLPSPRGAREIGEYTYSYHSADPGCEGRWQTARGNGEREVEGSEKIRQQSQHLSQMGGITLYVRSTVASQCDESGTEATISSSSSPAGPASPYFTAHSTPIQSSTSPVQHSTVLF